MKIGRGTAIQRHLGQLFEGKSVAGLGEVQLLERYIEHRDEPAFATLVARHGPMVLGVCRRLLTNPLDVEDAFQATFLVLARRAASLKDRERLAPWLFGVARRVAIRARADVTRRRSREKSGVEEIAAVPDHADLTRELGAAMVEEIDRLPAVLRDSILLCYVEGLTYDEAAARLRSTAPAIRCRLARAKGRLKDRLTRRGFAPTVASLGALLAAEGASAAVPSPLLTTTIQVAKAGAVPAVVDILAEGVIRTMILTKSKTLAVALVACGIAGTSLGFQAQGPASPTAESKSAEPTKTTKVDPPARLDGADATALSLLGSLFKVPDLKDLGLSVKVSTDGTDLKKLDPATKALVEAALKGVDIKDLKGDAEVVQKDGKTMIILPGKVTKTAKVDPPSPPARPEGADATALSLIEGLSKIADLKDINLSVKVDSDGAALEKLDPTTRALVEAALKGVDIKDLKGNAEVVQKDGKTMIIVPGKITIDDRSPSSPSPNAREDALEAKIKRLEARVEELERKNGQAPK